MAVEQLISQLNHRQSPHTRHSVLILTWVLICGCYLNNLPGAYAATQQLPVDLTTQTDEGALLEGGVTEELVPPGPITILPGDCLRDLFSKYSTDGRVNPNGFIKLLKNLGLGEDIMMEQNNDDKTEDLFADHAHKRAIANTTSAPPQRNERQISSQEPTPISNLSSETVTSSVESPTGGVMPVTNQSLNHGSHADHHRNNYHVTECLSAEAVLEIFDEGTKVGLTEQQFLQVCPVLLQQLDSHVCVQINLNGGGGGDLRQGGGTTDRCGITATTEGDMEDQGTDIGVHHVWGYAFAAVTLISMASIVCILVVPCMQRFPLIYGRLLSFLVAVAVGTLSGDAVMHLMPHAFGIHGHKDEVAVVATAIPGCGDEVTTTGHDDHGEADGADNMANNAVIKGLVVLIGIFSFFVIEQVMQLCRSCKQKRRKAETNGSGNYTPLKTGEEVGSKICNHSGEVAERLSRVPDPTTETQLDSLIANDKSQPSKTSVVYSCHPERRDSQTSSNSQHVTICVHSDAKIHITPNPGQCESNQHGGGGDHHKHEHNDYQHGSHDGYHDNQHHHGEHHHHGDGGHVEKSADDHGHGHRHGHSHDAPPANAGIATLAWIIVMGDGLHNFCDGLVVGAAFADSLAGGLSTAIAVMCHELPHELGDFAVMLKAGMSIKQALAFQGLSSILAYVGMAIGVAAGNVSMISLWIFALAAGMFLYIALADLFPAMVETTLTTTDSKGCHLFLQILGVMVGVGLMLAIGLLEEDLMAALSRGRGIS